MAMNMPAAAAERAKPVPGLELHGVENLQAFLEALWD